MTTLDPEMYLLHMSLATTMLDRVLSTSHLR